ncbi:helix-turn-helix domain-containing protein [Desulfolithobacter sp.]
MNPLEKHLGRSLSAAEVAEYLRCDITTVYRNYKLLGGIRIGRAYRFFEHRLIDAVLRQTEKGLDRSDKVQEAKISILPPKQDRREEMGSQRTGKTPGNGNHLADPHGLVA